MKALLAAASLAALCANAPQASANIIADATHPFSINTTQGLLPIYFNQPYLPFFTTKPSQRIKLTFSSNCNTDGWLYLQALIDGLPARTDNNVYSLYCHGADLKVAESLVTKIGSANVLRPGPHTLTINALFYGSWYTLYAVTTLVEN